MNIYTLASLIAFSALGLVACANIPTPPPSVTLQFRDLAPSAQIVTVKVGYPWYIPRFAIVDAYRKTIPDYQAATGLGRKSFSFSSDGRLGGVYLWNSKNAAEIWFNRAWYEKAKGRFGYDPDLRFIGVVRALEGTLAPTEEGAFAVAITAGSLEKYQHAQGLRAAYEGEGLVVSSWISRSAAQAFFEPSDSIEWFETPVTLANN